MELRPIVQRTLRKRVWWTRALRRRSALVLALARQFGVGGNGGGLARTVEDHRVRILWPPMLPKDDVTEVQNQVRLVTAGLRSHRTAMDALGTESPEEELARVLSDREALGEEIGGKESGVRRAGDDDAGGDSGAGA